MKKLLFLLLLVSSFGYSQKLIVNGHRYVSATPVDVDFTGVFTESPAHVWSPPLNFGVASNTLAGDGIYYVDYLDISEAGNVLGLDATNVAGTYTTFDYAIYASGTYHMVVNGTDTNTGVAVADGDKFGIRRTGTTFTAEYYRSGSWTVIDDFAATTSALMYLHANIVYPYRNPKILE